MPTFEAAAECASGRAASCCKQHQEEDRNEHGIQCRCVIIASANDSNVARSLIPATYMTGYVQQLEAAVEGFTDSQREDGGWGVRKRTPSSIVNTAEVLAVLRAGGVAADNQVVSDAIEFLLKAVPEHWLDPNRGKHTRYPTYGLLGLTEFLDVSMDSRVQDGVAKCLQLLEEQQRTTKSGISWPDEPTQLEGTIFATSMAMVALTRARVRSDWVSGAGDWLAAERVGDSPAWAMGWSGQPNPAMTALAVLGLSASARHLRLARAGGQHLAKNPIWTRRVDRDDSVQSARWTHFTYSLALRACLRTSAVPPESPVVADTLAYVHRLWLSTDAQWREGENDVPSVRGTYHAVLANEAVREALAQRMDPRDMMPPVLEDGYWDVRIGSSIELRSSGKQNWATVHLPDAGMRLVRRLAEACADGVCAPVGKSDLASALALSLTSVGAYVGRVNERVYKTLASGRPSVPDLVVAGRRGTGTYRLNALVIEHRGG